MRAIGMKHGALMINDAKISWTSAVWPWCAHTHTHTVPRCLLEGWIPQTGLHGGCDPDSVHHCIMGALGTLGALQREYVHCDVRGFSDLRSQTHELPCTLVHTQSCTKVFIQTYQPLTFLSRVQSHVWTARSLLEGASRPLGGLRGAAS